MAGGTDRWREVVGPYWPLWLIVPVLMGPVCGVMSAVLGIRGTVAGFGLSVAVGMVWGRWMWKWCWRRYERDLG